MTMDLVKLVSASWETHGGQRWRIGVPVAIPAGRRGTELCSDQVLHAYRSCEQALLMNPMHGNFDDSARLVRATAPDVAADDGTKVGVHEITLTEEIGRPDWWVDPVTRRRVQVQFAVLCARAVLHFYEDRYPADERPRKAIEAAEAYLAGKPNAAKAAKAAYAAAAKAAYAADDAAAYAAAKAAYAAAYAACADDAAAYAAAKAAYAAAYAACAGTYAADAAVDAAYAAKIDTAALAAEAVRLATLPLTSNAERTSVEGQS